MPVNMGPFSPPLAGCVIAFPLWNSASHLKTGYPALLPAALADACEAAGGGSSKAATANRPPDVYDGPIERV